jgi:hypothetical protein
VNTLITIVIILLQFIAGQFLGFTSAYALGVGNGWELVVIPVGNTLGVWGVGAIAARLRGTFTARQYNVRLLGTAIGSAIGVAAILLTPAIGFVQVLFPLAGAMLGYYLAPRIRS